MKKTVLIIAVIIGFTTVNAQEVIHINEAQFKEKVWDYETNKEWKFEGDVPVIVDFYADWCPPCKKLAPELKALQKEYGNKIRIYKVDVDKHGELAKLFSVRSIPTLIYAPMEGKYKKFTGYKTKTQLKKDVASKLKVR